MGNVFHNFKDELGYATVSNQYIELMCRISADAHEKELDRDQFHDTAQRYGLSISVAPTDIKQRIAGYYIIQVHSCVEHFLGDYQRLVGSPTYQKTDYDNKKDDKLNWTMNHVFSQRTIFDQEQYYICNYYRLFRNAIIHKLDIKKELTRAYEKVQGIQTGKLIVFQQLGSISFDDQVLYARTATSLFERIFYQSEYQWDLILNNKKTAIITIIQRYPNDRDKQKTHIVNYLKRFYPISELDLPTDLNYRLDGMLA